MAPYQGIRYYIADGILHRGMGGVQGIMASPDALPTANGIDTRMEERKHTEPTGSKREEDAFPTLLVESLGAQQLTYETSSELLLPPESLTSQASL